MNNNLTELVVIMDRSGSMWPLANDTINGFNSLIEKQKADTNGDVHVTVVLFNTSFNVLYDCVDIKEIPKMTSKDYFPSGGTALLDAVGNTITSVGKRLADTPEEERPANVMFVITTDGYENSSREYNQKQIADMIEHQKTKYSWTFMFLGANIDAESVGKSYNIDYAKTYTASSIGTKSVFRSVDSALGSMKKASADGETISSACMMGWLDEVE